MAFLKGDNFRIEVRDDDHEPPHCHVIYSDGTDAFVIIPTIIPLFGKLTKKAKKMIEDNLDDIVDEWDRLNPRKH